MTRAAIALPPDTDVVVIGGGTMGLFSALFLARAGRRVVVIEKGEPWAEASGSNAGSLAIQNKIPPLVPFALEALRMWQQLHVLLGKDVGYRITGGFRIATSDRECDRLRESMANLTASGVQIEWLEGSQLREAAPFLSPAVRAATFWAQDGYGNPLALGPALANAAVAAGVVLCPGIAVLSVSDAPDLVITTSAGHIRCATVVIAAGAWSAKVAQLFGTHLPMSLGVNIMSVTEPTGPVVPRLVTHIRPILTVKQVANGTCLIGGGWQGIGDLESGRKDINYESILHNIRAAVAIVPALARLSIIRQWSAFEGVTPDKLPYFGRLPQRPDVFITACVNSGFTCGPIFGRLMSELILTGDCSMPVNDFNPGRFGNA